MGIDIFENIEKNFFFFGPKYFLRKSTIFIDNEKNTYIIEDRVHIMSLDKNLAVDFNPDERKKSVPYQYQEILSSIIRSKITSRFFKPNYRVIRAKILSISDKWQTRWNF